MSKKLLLTGFGPFGSNTSNPTTDIVKELEGLVVNEFNIISKELPVSYQKLDKLLPEIYQSDTWDAIIHLGLASDQKKITPEKVALNLIDSKNPDNDGECFLDKKIIETGDSLYSTLPVRKMVKSLAAEKIPAEISYSAGVYVCNYTMYHCLHYIQKNNFQIPAGFIHVPQISTETPISMLIKGIKLCISAI